MADIINPMTGRKRKPFNKDDETIREMIARQTTIVAPTPVEINKRKIQRKIERPLFGR